jgi:hypothetical protein
MTVEITNTQDLFLSLFIGIFLISYIPRLKRKEKKNRSFFLFFLTIRE